MASCITTNLCRAMGYNSILNVHVYLHYEKQQLATGMPFWNKHRVPCQQLFKRRLETTIRLPSGSVRHSHNSKRIVYSNYMTLHCNASDLQCGSEDRLYLQASVSKRATAIICLQVVLAQVIQSGSTKFSSSSYIANVEPLDAV